MAYITFEQIKNDATVSTYIRQADVAMKAYGYTEHSFPHVTRTAQIAAQILEDFGYDRREVELAQIAGFLHDIGNCINRVDHAQSGALMAFQILTALGMPPEEIAKIIAAIGNHDESSAVPVSSVAAALILADKTDVRRSRVRNRNIATFDIHDRVNYSVEHSEFSLNTAEKIMTLNLTIDSELCPVMDYFEIFLGRMVLCKRAADFFESRFRLIINGLKVM
ncbi:MAG: HD domain-containing protein [Oscillospiraceae bacterium]|nr:HD domain-containing protein [Oscillospiraceae bacterium]